MLHLASRLSLSAIALLVLGLAASVQAQTAAPVDRSDPVATATTFLKAYADKDLDVMARTMNPEIAAMLAEVKAEGETHRGYREIFGGWRHEAAVAWDGAFGEARTKTFVGGDKTYLMLPFHTSGEGWIGVLMMLRDDTGWFVDDIERWEVENYRENPAAAL